MIPLVNGCIFCPQRQLFRQCIKYFQLEIITAKVMRIKLLVQVNQHSREFLQLGEIYRRIIDKGP